MRRLIYEIRWLRWFLFDGHWPTKDLYHSWQGPLDKESRRIIIDRTMSEWMAREPQYRGTYPHHDKKV